MTHGCAKRVPPYLRWWTCDFFDERRVAAARTHGILTLLRQASTPRRREYYCQICLCNRSAKHGVSLQCGHLFCQECLLAYTTSKIQEAQRKT